MLDTPHRLSDTETDNNANTDGLLEQARALYARTRAQSAVLAEGLSDADMTVQAIADASPAKWHLAHTTWFFEAFILDEFAGGYQCFSDDFAFLFNSYYETLGARQPRPERGMLTRPSAQEIMAYRAHVDQAMDDLFDTVSVDTASEGACKIAERATLGCHHEQQHQELLLTDILYLFAQNPLKPAFREGKTPGEPTDTAPLGWQDFEGGIVKIGHDLNAPNSGFAYDNESPRHDALLQNFRLADRLVTNGEWCDFIDDGGYATATVWLADGWAAVNEHGWGAPLYWERIDGGWHAMSLHGRAEIDRAAPVTHISYFEADAFARWAGKRLPTEFEWEHAAANLSVDGNFLSSGALKPLPAATGAGGGTALKQMFGDVWEWTGSGYLPYPGFKPQDGAIGEYNGKFMSGQFVLKGGSCATAQGHARAGYRNFFYPHQRWQFSGVRLAEDA